MCESGEMIGTERVEGMVLRHSNGGCGLGEGDWRWRVEGWFRGGTMVTLVIPTDHSRRLSIHVFGRPIGSGEGLHLLPPHTMASTSGFCGVHWTYCGEIVKRYWRCPWEFTVGWVS